MGRRNEFTASQRRHVPRIRSNNWLGTYDHGVPLSHAERWKIVAMVWALGAAIAITPNIGATVGAQTGHCAKTVRRIWLLYINTGDVEPRKQGGHRRQETFMTGAVLKYMALLVRLDPTLMLQPMQSRIAQDLGVQLSIAAICRGLSHLSLNRKRLQRLSQEAFSVAALAYRNLFLAWQLGVQRGQVICLDEFGINMHTCSRSYGRAPSGRQPTVVQPGDRGAHFTCIAAMTVHGPLADFVFDGHCNRAIFLVWFMVILLPYLGPFTYIVLDNASWHDVHALTALLAGTGKRVIFIPARSPWYNPIEYMFGTVRVYMRRNPDHCRLHPKRSMYEAIDLVKATSCDNWFRHCGYL